MVNKQDVSGIRLNEMRGVGECKIHRLEVSQMIGDLIP